MGIHINRHLQPFDKIDHQIQAAVDLPSIITQTANPQPGLLPQIQVVDLGNSHIKPVMNFVLYAFDNLALFLQGMRFRQIKYYFQDPDDHKKPKKGFRVQGIRSKGKPKKDQPETLNPTPYTVWL
jgi:hypothetical protein